ncbi:MAG: hypothetical protein FK734_14695 [Asgard group archaeon]|nr:hypothetical protein [Asgard group archaeon]
MSQQLFDNLSIIKEKISLSNIFDKMMLELYPKVKTINSQIAKDLGFLFIYRHLETEEDKDVLIKFWRSKTNHQILQLPMGEYHYRPYIDFIYLDRIMNGLFIENSLEQLIKFDQLSFDDSCAILFDLERYYVVPLSEMDVKIIETIHDSLKQDKEYTNDNLSAKLNVRANYISRRIGYLRNNAYFRVTGTVNYPKIGLYLYIILIESAPEFSDIIPDYFSSPFTRTIRRCPNQRYDYIISLTLPKSYEHNLFDYLFKLSEESKIRSFYCDEVKTISNNLDFTYYEYSKRPTVLTANKPGFFIDWFKERVMNMPSKINTSYNDIFHKFTFEGKNFNYTITDLKLMTLYRRDLDSSVRTLSKKLSLSWDDTNFHLERIKGIFFPMILLYYMGLNQTAILFFENISADNLNKLEIILSRMPQVFCYTFKNGGAILTVDLMNGAHRLNDLIRETLPNLKNTQFFLASKTSGIFRPIPYKFYNEEDASWFFPKNFFLDQIDIK